MNTNTKNILIIVLVLLGGFWLYSLVFPKTNITPVKTTQSYQNPKMGFSVEVPLNYKIEESDRVVKFTVPLTVSTGTNLSTDTYLSVESPADPKECVSGTTTDAAAGNRYEDTTYVVPGSNPCLITRYFIHYGVIDNYPVGLVKEFDKPALIHEFDTIRGSLKLSQ